MVRVAANRIRFLGPNNIHVLISNFVSVRTESMHSYHVVTIRSILFVHSVSAANQGGVIKTLCALPHHFQTEYYLEVRGETQDDAFHSVTF